MMDPSIVVWGSRGRGRPRGMGEGWGGESPHNVNYQVSQKWATPCVLGLLAGRRCLLNGRGSGAAA